MATAAASSAGQNPKKAVEPAPPPSAKPDPPNTTAIPSPVAGAPQKDSEGLKKTVSTVDSVLENDSTPVADIQKKIRRAERFGMPVQLSEEEKRNSRAERFGTGITSNGTEVLKKSEEQKRKARAERFGLTVPSTAADEEAKRKSRLARFAPYIKADSQEEDKRKARAIRFSNPPPNSSSQVNGKGNIELKAATVADNAGGGS